MRLQEYTTLVWSNLQSDATKNSKTAKPEEYHGRNGLKGYCNLEKLQKLQPDMAKVRKIFI
jgi:hypothetical protein